VWQILTLPSPVFLLQRYPQNLVASANFSQGGYRLGRDKKESDSTTDSTPNHTVHVTAARLWFCISRMDTVGRRPVTVSVGRPNIIGQHLMTYALSVHSKKEAT
jgi:hypothetical protein